ncbi:MAG TPA: AsmA family protein [Steroidobacteraceae bacterium]|nr:AsmA family protein [Steroidobacteraceae bacterium]
MGTLALDSSWLGLAVVHHIAAQAQREIRIAGPVHAHFFSFAPRLTAEGVTLGNPPWVSRGTAASIGKLTLLLRWSSPRHPLELEALEMKGATVALLRDAAGRSNWQWGAPGTPVAQRPPMIHGLAVPDAEVRLDDDTLHLHFRGKVSACAGADASGRRPCRIRGEGELNGRAVLFTVDGEPLATARRGAPYRFTFEESSTGSHLSGRGVLPRAFDFGALDATFEAQGADLKDLYFLTGVSLIDTRPYQLHGQVQRRGGLLAFRNLAASAGKSDLSGTVLVHGAAGKTFIEAALGSERLRLQDLGVRAAGRAPPSSAQSQFLLPATSLGLERLRNSRAAVRFAAHSLALGRVELQAAEARIAFGQGAIVLHPMSATLAGGKLSGKLRIDVATPVPVVRLELQGTDVHLGELDGRRAASSGSQPPLEGRLEARLTLTARGDSPRALAATADGRFTAIVPHGAIRASIAELAGLDFVRLLGLKLGTSHSEATVHCGIASLRARDGALSVERLMIDTGPARVTGRGEVNLRSEALDLRLRDEPTHVRLLGKRLPLSITGTLKHPRVRVEGPDALGKIGATAALGAVLAPVDALLHLIKPGRTRDSDCAAVLGEGVTVGAARR